MNERKGLKTIANKLAESFINSANLNLLRHIELAPNISSKFIVFDVLKKKIFPKELKKTSKRAISHYNKWFNEEIKKLNIPIDNIKDITINISYKPGRSSTRYYTCHVKIKTDSGEYEGKSDSTCFYI
ncbi:MAG: hypothetical protein QXS38_00860 [Candidatus Pacearchaeota archaeon]